jgi:hypothetical protein
MERAALDFIVGECWVEDAQRERAERCHWAARDTVTVA